jgi:hypothetical protein
MELAGESWRVLGHISARDQQEEMQALGLLSREYSGSGAASWHTMMLPRHVARSRGEDL